MASVRLRSARAFTLIEMVFVVVVIGIMMTASFLAFRGFTGTSDKVDGNELLTSMATRQLAFARDWGQFTSFPADMPAVSNGADLVTTASTGPDKISAAVGSSGTLGLAVRTKSGDCVHAQVAPLVVSGDITFGTTTLATCSGTAALPATETALASTKVAQ
jgi:prepilin-type N-terminal cleavage/methylation domain-containing protein